MNHTDYTFEGISILQHPDIQRHFEKIIHSFNRIIELGTYYGALTLYLHRIKRPDCELISFDVDTNLCKVPKEYKLDTRYGNYFDEPTITEIRDLIIEPNRRVLLLCDGGYKEYEVNKFCEFLKPGDVIMCHDYAETLEEFKTFTEPIGWGDIPESYYCNIIENLNKFGLTKYEYYDEFKSVLWGSFIKNIWTPR